MTAGSHPAAALRTVDTHVAGEPARLVLDAAQLLRGATPAERREDLLSRQRWIRTGLMREPRGHRDMFGVIVVPPSDTAAADVGAVFMEHDGSPMSCGHGTVGLVSAIVERGIVAGLEQADLVRVETPAGVVPVAVERDSGGALESIVLHQPAAGVAARLSLPHPVQEGREVRAVLTRGASWVMLVDEAELGVEVAGTDTETLIALVQRLRAAVLDWLGDHPQELDGDAEEAIAHLSGSPVAIIGRPTRADCAVRTFVGFGERSVDRSPCGTAVSALAALRGAEGMSSSDGWIGVEGISGERFEVSIGSASPDGRVSALVRGRGYVTGTAVFEFDEDDPFRSGFAL